MPLSKLTTDQIRKEAEDYAEGWGENDDYAAYKAGAERWAIWKDKEVKGLVEALDGIIKEPYGCPMCDSGRLRNEKKQHWDDCPFLIAAKAIEQFEKIEK